MDEEATSSLAQFITNELTTAFAMWGERHDLPLIHWVCTLPRTGRTDLFIGLPTSFYDDDERCAQAALWAEILGGFERHEDIQPGCVGYVGDIAGIETTILAVRDRDEYEFWLQVNGPDEPVPDEEVEPVRGTDYQPWPEVDLDGLGEIRALTKLMDIAFSRAFGTWALTQELPPMSWMTNTPLYNSRDPILMGVPTDDTGDVEGVDHAQRWAQALGLRQCHYTAGMIKYSGIFAGIPVLVAALTDKTAAHRAVDALE